MDLNNTAEALSKCPFVAGSESEAHWYDGLISQEWEENPYDSDNNAYIPWALGHDQRWVKDKKHPN